MPNESTGNYYAFMRRVNMHVCGFILAFIIDNKKRNTNRMNAYGFAIRTHQYTHTTFTRISKHLHWLSVCECVRDIFYGKEGVQFFLFTNLYYTYKQKFCGSGVQCTSRREKMNSTKSCT